MNFIFGHKPNKRHQNTTSLTQRALKDEKRLACAPSSLILAKHFVWFSTALNVRKNSFPILLMLFMCQELLIARVYF